ncbi:DUF1588 domain-containing protein [Akkermansiaceae bacterium]|nr:DUF1588 domain-containing protein [Akkermansiaceae bacterium]
MRASAFIATAITASISTGWAEGNKAAAAFTVPENAEAILDRYCYNCHDEDSQKGDIQLDDIGSLDTQKRLDLLNRVQEQIYFQHMPPKNKRQPDEAERKAILAVISAELGNHNASTLEGKLQKPEYGNYIDHEKLFSGEYKDVPAYTTDRRWLISEFIFNAKFQRILEKKTMANRGKKRFEVVGSKRLQEVSLANPFLLPKTIGVRYYANEDLTGGHLSSMLTNAQAVSEYITDVQVPKSKGKYLPAAMEIIAMEEAHAATITARRAFLESHIERICEEIYGDRNESMLPTFVPVVLQPLPELKEGEKYKKAPMGVSTGMLEKLGAAPLVYHTLTDPNLSQMSDDELRGYFERVWFYRGDHERTIQSRMAILREYVSDFRGIAQEQLRRHKKIEYTPLADEEMAVIRASIQQHRKKGDRYNTLIDECVTDWEQSFAQQRKDAGPPSPETLTALAGQLSGLILEREPTPAETSEYVALTQSYVEKLGRRKAVQKLIQTFLLSTEFAYRNELGAGEPDEHGRRMMSPRDASYAIAYALTDQSPDAELVAAATSGRLNTREDYKREVERLLARRDVRSLIDPILEDKSWAENTTDMPIRELRFFREFFGYPKALEIFKDEKRFGGDRLDQATNRVVNEADRIVEYILEKDKNVFEELIGTEEFYVFHDGDNEAMTADSDLIKRIYAYFKDKDWKNFGYKELAEHTDFLRKNPMRNINPDNLKSGNRSGDGLKLFKKSMTSITARLDKGQKDAAPFDMYRGYGSDFMPGENVAMLWGYSKDNWNWSATQPAKVPNRKGMLTHPAWLLAHAFNTETDPVHRGKFVREKLLAGTIPDVPITVDAVIPEDHNKTLRDRLAMATETKSCWHCHEKMNPLGNTFEMYDDFGRFRTEEYLEYPEHLVTKRPDEAKDRNHLLDLRDIYKTLPVDSSGHLAGTEDPSLDGDLVGAVDLAERLSKSRRVRQSFIRHAFRYFMGRNEFLSDSKTLIDAEQAYVNNGGSFDAAIVSLLTSDSFIYRKPAEN